MNEPYVRQIPRSWWLRRFVYTKFMFRELTSVFVGLYLIELLCFVTRIPKGPEAVAEFFTAIRSPGWIIFHVVTLLLALFHTITWFNLTPKVMPLRMGEKKVAGWLLAGVNSVAWIVVSGLIAWIIL